jgi:16S rRNA (uracil1498-N3)-methyltransferase
MRPPVFVAGPGQLRHDPIVLSGPEGRHAATVRRLSAGERADLTDGAGTIAQCVVRSAAAGVIEFTVLARHTEPPPEPSVAVVQAIAKGDRGELAVELMTEVGVDVVLPWQAERCVAQWRGDRAGRALERWRATAREAAKQSRRAWFPEVTRPAGISEIAARIEAASLAVVLDPDADVSLHQLRPPASGQVVAIVGPEGGISPAEAAGLIRAGAVAARLGPGILRSSTAGAVAAAVLLSNSGRWG